MAGEAGVGSGQQAARSRAGHPEALLLVGLKHVGEAEPLAAHVTRGGLLACVSPTVPSCWGVEAFATDFTDSALLR